MSDHIEDFEKVFISDYLNEMKEEIFYLLKKYKIKYFKRDNSNRYLFFDKNDIMILRAFYNSVDKYISIDEYRDEKVYNEYRDERIRLYFKELNSENLWSGGIYFRFIVDQILKLDNLPIEVW